MTAAIIPFPVKGTSNEEWQREQSVALYRADIERYRMAIDINTDLLMACESRLARLLAATGPSRQPKRRGV
ncbi:hypothetical protein GG804_11660 [Sphingomonas histidinilytica]|uniref:hypothetical protein n=1 Tax=Rhizorhabdus histidinilytica TaxID=439228 RepID=UPI001ADBB7A3|nr:hypothetical protein [Rhizorhabdus histidinilytica]MBO9377425.1 hypothetical protein [Rhizorhabdus histidinilytica]